MDEPSLQMVREILCHPQRLDRVVQAMLASDAWDGMLARIGGQLTHSIDRERASVLTTLARHTRFLDSIAVSHSTRTSSFDPGELLKGRMTIYLILPPDRMKSQAPLLRMWVTSFLRAVVKGGLQQRNLVHFVLDEAASLGQLDAIDDLVDKYRGYGVRGQFYYQSLGQLKKCFPDGGDQTLLSNTTQVYFGVNDNVTGDYVSSRIGESTVIVASGGTSQGRTSQTSYGGQTQTSHGASYTTSDNWGQQVRKLLKPEEVMSLPPRTALTFCAGLPPIRTTLLRYFEEMPADRSTSGFGQFVRGLFTLAASAALCAACITAAVVLTSVLLTQLR
jgi:type IV secretion system protein VirD4